MGDRTLEDIVKQALAEGLDIQWIAHECWTHDLSRLVPLQMQEAMLLRSAERELAAAQHKVESLRARLTDRGRSAMSPDSGDRFRT